MSREYKSSSLYRQAAGYGLQPVAANKGRYGDESLAVDLVFPCVISFTCRSMFSLVFETITLQRRLATFKQLLHMSFRW